MDFKIFENMNHGQLLIYRPEEAASLIDNIHKLTSEHI